MKDIQLLLVLKSILFFAFCEDSNICSWLTYFLPNITQGPVTFT